VIRTNLAAQHVAMEGADPGWPHRAMVQAVLDFLLVRRCDG